MITLHRRDWFGVAGFDPGSERLRRGGFLYLLDEVGSTNDFLLERGDPAEGRLCRWDGWGWSVGDRRSLPPPRAPRPGSVVVARCQTAGRGRMGRRWQGGQGLTLSWLIDPLPLPQAARLAVWTGLIAALALRDLSGEPVRLKWPNDLRLRGRKLGGILLDMVVRGAETRFVAGLGVNVGDWSDEMPAELRRIATSLAPSPRRWSSLAHLAGAILRRWDAEVLRFLVEGWAAYRDDYDAVDELAGRRIVLTRGNETLAGLVRGIDDDGALRLEGPDGRVDRWLAGDVHIVDTGEGEDGSCC